MAGIYDVHSSELIPLVASKLKKMDPISPPIWTAFVKTGNHKERPPVQKDWWYTRAAAVLLTIDGQGIVGVQRLRTKYGGKKNRGYKPERFRKGSGSIARKILQQLDAAGLTKQGQKGNHKGRMITAKGKKFLKESAAEIKPASAQTTAKHTKAAEHAPTPIAA